MAQYVSTMDSYDSARKVESFADDIYNQDREETPFVSMLNRRSIDNLHPEWMNDSLEAPGQNAQIEADEFSYEMPVEPERVGTYTQILRKAWRISNSLEKMDKAGQKSELGRQRRIKGVLLRRDMELALLQNAPSVVGNSNTPSRTAGFLAWLKTNTNRGSGGSDGGFNTSTGIVDAAINGTKRAFTKAILDDIIAQGYTSNISAKTLMVPPYVKRVFSTFMSDANVVPLRTAVTGTSQATIIAGADEYLGDFGKVSIMVNPLMAITPVGETSSSLARNAILYDPNMVDLGVFRDISEIKPAITGDAEPRVLITQICLYMKNEKAHAVAADLYGLTASS